MSNPGKFLDFKTIWVIKENGEFVPWSARFTKDECISDFLRSTVGEFLHHGPTDSGKIDTHWERAQYIGYSIESKRVSSEIAYLLVPIAKHPKPLDEKEKVPQVHIDYLMQAIAKYMEIGLDEVDESEVIDVLKELPFPN